MNGLERISKQRLNAFLLRNGRILEIPTPCWSTYDAVRNNLPLLKDAQASIQERALSSPI